MTKPTRQLPGVKGQWILAADCPPTEADGDEDGHVRVASPDVKDWWRYVHWSDVRTDRYWIPEFNYLNKDPRPLVLPAAPALKQAASTDRPLLARVADLLWSNIFLFGNPNYRTLYARVVILEIAAWLKENPGPNSAWRAVARDLLDEANK